MNNVNDQLFALRSKIDQIDNSLLELLSKRAKTVKKIGNLKVANKIKPLDKKRWAEVLTSNVSRGKRLGFTPKFIRKIFNIIHEYSLDLERKKKI